MIPANQDAIKYKMSKYELEEIEKRKKAEEEEAKKPLVLDKGKKGSWKEVAPTDGPAYDPNKTTASKERAAKLSRAEAKKLKNEERAKKAEEDKEARQKAKEESRERKKKEKA